MPPPLAGQCVVVVGNSIATDHSVGRLTQYYCRALRELGAHVETIVFEEHGIGNSALPEEGFACHVLGVPGHSRSLRGAHRLAAKVAELGVDCLHAQCYEPAIACSRAKLWGACSRLMISHHDSRRRWSRRLISWPYGRIPDRVISASQGAAEAHRHWYGYPADHMRVLPFPVSDQFFEPQPEGHDLRRELGLEGAYPIVIWPARLHRLKGHAELLRAWPQVLARHPRGRLLLVGEGRMKSSLAKLAGDLGVAKSVVFAGFRRDIAALLATADILACPSHSEALCTSILEAMAVGTPVVSTSVWGTPEHIVPGQTGLLVPIGSPEALAEALCQVADDPQYAARLGQAARAHALERFSMDGFTAALERIYAGE
jgi:glycosyltransferase involved in cell wall biosynthesis